MQRLGSLTAALSGVPFNEALDILAEIGVKELEVGTGGYPGNAHCDRRKLLGNSTAQQDWLQVARDHGMEVGAFAVHGNPFHPNTERAIADDIALRETITLAGEMSIPTVVCFSGLPGTPGSTGATWELNAWPPEHLENSEQQFETLVHYWQEINLLAKDANTGIAIEMHPNMGVHNTRTMLELNKAAGAWIGANFDPSHLGWRGMDSVRVIRALLEAECLFHVHAKEYRTDKDYIALNGCVDCVPWNVRRPWQFATVGTGDIGIGGWHDILAALREGNFRGMISMEHEDRLRSPIEGMRLAAENLSPILYVEDPGDKPWEK